MKHAFLKLIALHEYTEKGVRSASHKLKEGDPETIEEVAKEIATRVPMGATIVPMPNHQGRAVTTLKLAKAVAKYANCRVFNCLQGNKRRPFHDLKLEGETATDFGFKCTQPINPFNAYLLDNVVDTGATFRAAAKASGIYKIITYAYTNNF